MINKKACEFDVEAIWNNNFPAVLPTLEKYFKVYRTDNDDFKYLYVYKPNSILIDLHEVKNFIDFLHTIPTNKNGRNLLPIYINFEQTKFADKLIYIMFETIILYLITEKNWLVSVEGKFEPENCSNGVQNSSLAHGNWHLSEMDNPNFEENLLNWNTKRVKKYKYSREETDSLSHSRYFVNVSNKESNVGSDIHDFLDNSVILQGIDKKIIKRISKTILEIISNCTEHTQCPYIYDIDVKKVIHNKKTTFQGKPYIAINVGVWDFSNVRLGDAIKEKIHIIGSPNSTEKQITEQMGKKEKIFKKLLEVYKTHTNFFTDHYTEDDFFALSAFQPGVTGRSSPERTGGAGLAHVLDFLKDYPDNYKCYCLTGDTIINFNKDYLNKDCDNWYTFNDSQECIFPNHEPSYSCVSKAPLFYPGTAFFLHLELN